MIIDPASLTQALDSLTARQRITVVAKYSEPTIRTDADVATELGLCRSAITRRRLRALERLRNHDNFVHITENVTFSAVQPGRVEG